MRNQNTKKLVLAAVLIALGVAASPLYIPIGASKCFPVQHLVNVLAAVLLGPWYGVSMAFVTSLLRVLIGTGSLLAALTTVVRTVGGTDIAVLVLAACKRLGLTEAFRHGGA